MTSAGLLLQPNLPEWRRSGHFFAGAVVLHLAVLFYPLHLAIGKLETPSSTSVVVRLVEAVKALPVAPPPAAPSPAAPREVRRPTHRPVLAVSPEAASTSPVVVPAAPPAPAPVVERASAPVASPAPASLTPARFDAAYLHNPRPNYPPLSRRLGEEGKVLLKVKVSPAGQALAVDVEKSSNFERLDEAARQAVVRWRFVPARRGDENVEASVIVPLVFRLED